MQDCADTFLSKFGPAFSMSPAQILYPHDYCRLAIAVFVFTALSLWDDLCALWFILLSLSYTADETSPAAKSTVFLEKNITFAIESESQWIDRPNAQVVSVSAHGWAKLVHELK